MIVVATVLVTDSVMTEVTCVVEIPGPKPTEPVPGGGRCGNPVPLPMLPVPGGRCGSPVPLPTLPVPGNGNGSAVPTPAVPVAQMVVLPAHGEPYALAVSVGTDELFSVTVTVWMVMIGPVSVAPALLEEKPLPEAAPGALPLRVELPLVPGFVGDDNGPVPLGFVGPEAVMGPASEVEGIPGAVGGIDIVMVKSNDSLGVLELLGDPYGRGW